MREGRKAQRTNKILIKGNWRNCWFQSKLTSEKGKLSEIIMDQFFMKTCCWCCSVIQSLSRVQLFAIPWSAKHQASLSITNSWSLLKLMSSELVMPSNHLILSSPSPVFNLSQHQGLFQWVSSLYQVAKVLEFQYQSFQWIFSLSSEYWFPLGLTGFISLLSKGLSRVFSNTTVPKHQFFGTLLSLWSNSHIHTWLLEKP